MNRRSFLKAILLAASAPAIVRASSLMSIVPRGIDPRAAIALDLSAVPDSTAIWPLGVHIIKSPILISDSWYLYNDKLYTSTLEVINAL